MFSSSCPKQLSSALRSYPQMTSEVPEMTNPTLPHGGAQLGAIDGPLVMIGMGSIGRATLPLLDRHIAFDKSRAIALYSTSW